MGTTLHFPAHFAYVAKFKENEKIGRALNEISSASPAQIHVTPLSLT
jgi:hypothetical protein